MSAQMPVSPPERFMEAKAGFSGSLGSTENIWAV